MKEKTAEIPFFMCLLSSWQFALGYIVFSFRLICFIDKGETAFLVFLFTFVVSIIGLHVNKSPLMDLFLSLDGGVMSVALARLYAKYGLRFLNHLSPASYTIYLYHGIFQALSLQMLMRFTLLIQFFILSLLFYQAFMAPFWSISCFIVVVTAVWVESQH